MAPTTVSDQLDVLSPLMRSTWDSGARVRPAMFRVSYDTPSICTSAIELTPMLTPNRGRLRRCPLRPDAGKC